MTSPIQTPAYVEHVVDLDAAVPAGLGYIHLGAWPGSASGATAGQAPRDTSAAALFAAQRRLDDGVLDLLSPRPGDALLDAGCGIGGTIVRALERWPTLRATGLNIDARQLESAERLVARTHPDAERQWVAADACALPFPDASFDGIVAIECAFHFTSRRVFLGEARRAARKGGRLAGTDIVGSAGAPPPGSLHGAIGAVLAATLGPWPDMWGSEGDLATLARCAGWHCVAVDPITADALPSFAHFGVDPSTAVDVALDENADPLRRGVAALFVLLDARRLDVVRFAASADDEAQDNANAARYTHADG